MRGFKEIPDNEKSPCGSGKQYKDCNKKRNLKFRYRGEKIVKEVPINEELASDLKH